MKENSLLSDLAAHLFSNSSGNGRTPSERELAEHFGVSRGQVREALAILEAMRIVERRAKSGIYLTTTEASVEAMALFARAGVPLDPILIYETVELRKIHGFSSSLSGRAGSSLPGAVAQISSNAGNSRSRECSI